MAGCSLWETPSASTQGPDGVLPSIVTVKLVADMAVPWNMDADSIEGIGVVTCLTGTGSDPEPSAERAMLEAEMKTRGITSPSTMLASKNTSLVLLRAFVRPGAQKGDRVDVEVRIPSRSETTSLAGGYLLETRLKEMRILDSRIHDGHPLALAEGPILIDPACAPLVSAKIRDARDRVVRKLGLSISFSPVNRPRLV